MKNNYRIIFTGIFCCLILSYFSVFAAAEKPGLKFSHKKHVVENELECVTCHEAAESSKTGADNLIPSMETCGNCHDVEDDQQCKLCHSDPENPGNVPHVENYSQLFSHEKHLGAGLECETCHQKIKTLETVEPYILPEMTDCVSCHRSKNVSAECNVCHKPNERLKPLTHGPNFLHEHGDLARTGTETAVSGEKSCNLCHNVNYCQQCHEGDNLDRMTHPLNYEYTHSLDARGKERECTVCHTERSFCIDCHADNLVMPQNHTGGWANRLDGGRHRIEAENDLENCMSCHEADAEQVCQKCHSKEKVE